MFHPDIEISELLGKRTGEARPTSIGLNGFAMRPEGEKCGQLGSAPAVPSYELTNSGRIIAGGECGNIGNTLG